MYKILIKRYSSFDDVGLEFFSFELYIVASLSMFCTNTYIINVVKELQTFFSIFIKVPILIVRFHLIFGIISCSFFSLNKLEWWFFDSGIRKDIKELVHSFYAVSSCKHAARLNCHTVVPNRYKPAQNKFTGCDLTNFSKHISVDSRHNFCVCSLDALHISKLSNRCNFTNLWDHRIFGGFLTFDPTVGSHCKVL